MLATRMVNSWFWFCLKLLSSIEHNSVGNVTSRTLLEVTGCEPSPIMVEIGTADC